MRTTSGSRCSRAGGRSSTDPSEGLRLPKDIAARIAAGGERFAVTGASGWLGRATLEVLATAVSPDRFADRVVAVSSAPKDIPLRTGLVVRATGLDDAALQTARCDFVLHFGYLTREKAAVLGTDAYIAGNVGITARVVDLIERWHPRAVFCASAGSVYNAGGGFAWEVRSDPYGTLKRLDELAVRQACRDVGARSIVARVFAMAGPYMTHPEAYALGDFIEQLRRGDEIRIRARHRVLRSYAAVGDVVSLAVATLLAGADDEGDVVFDTGGETLELGDMARAVGEALGRDSITVIRDLDESRPPDRHCGDARAWSERLARHGISETAFADAVRQTAGFLQGTS